MYIWLAVTPIAEAGQQVADIDAAVKAVSGSVARIMERAPNMWDLPADASTMATRMRSEGVAALGAGKRWSASVGAIHVQLVPTRGLRPLK